MKVFLSTTGMYIWKTLKSARSWCGMLLYIGLLAVISRDIIGPDSDIPYIFHYAFANSTSYFLLVICALPASAVFAEEWKAKRFVSIYTRAKKKGFAASVILSSFLSAFCLSVTASVIYLGILSFSYPITGEITDIHFIQSAETYANGKLLLSGNTFLYYLISFGTQGCLMGLFSALSTMLSVKLTDPYIAVVMPMVLYIVITNICGIINLPTAVNPYYIYSPSDMLNRSFFSHSSNYCPKFSVFAALYPMIFSVIFLLLFTVIVNFWIKKKYESCNDIG